MYEFLTGPMLWVTFSVLVVVLTARVVLYIKGLNWQLDRVAYTEHFSYGIKGAFRSIIFFLLPFGNRSWRTKPGMTVLVFTFHIGLVVTPIFLLAHNIILNERLGISLPVISSFVADALSWAVIVSAIFLVLRRIAFPEVRILTTQYDYLLLLISVAPFVTGLLARYHVGDYDFWLLAHIFCGHVMLLAIPFTKLSHIVLFFMSRGQLGMDFGIKRGGMKGKGMAW
ncbi:MAG: hypothetical protein V1753_05855 [Pseudomonadota bacterium]